MILKINLISIFIYFIFSNCNVGGPRVEKTIINEENIHYTIQNENYYFENYKGEELDSEWNWVKNISIVYTWVDGSDINFLNIKNKYSNGNRKPSSRFRSVDELKYSIRSLEKYMPWFNGTIYIVTLNQVPKWLDTRNKRIKIINHKDIIPKHIYPTFDSNTIELFLDKIPEITERFIYFNDDLFLNNYVHPSLFFTKEGFYPKIYRNTMNLYVNEVQINEFILNNTHSFCCNNFFTDRLAKDYFNDKFVYQYVHHVPFVLYRDLFENYRQLFKEEFKSRIAYRFRNHFKIQTLYLYQVFMEYATQHVDFPFKLGGKGKAQNFQGLPLPQESTIKKFSAEVVDCWTAKKYIRFGDVVNDDRKNKSTFKMFKEDTKLIFFNMNDNYNKNSVSYDFIEFLYEKFPSPSSFENKTMTSIETSYFSKIDKINEFSNKMIEALPDKFNQTIIENFQKVITENKHELIKKYINDTQTISGSLKEISDNEKEELNILLNYNGTELEKKWKWCESISIVYLIENHRNHTHLEVDLLSLKYSLRSIENYLPWFLGKIFIIIPNLSIIKYLPWLNLKNSRISLINQTDILPKQFQLSANRHLVELYLDKIPGLSEKFIYMNSYYYFKKYVHPRFFFSKEFYPKYYFRNCLNREGEEIAKDEDISFYKTYSIIKEYFGKNYIKLRYLKEVPFTYYRDLYEPVRTLYKSYIEKSILTDINNNNNNLNFELLPLYLLSTYNVYGTEQPFFPDYVVGFGKLMNLPPPILNNNRTIDYYGFDIASPEIEQKTMILYSFFSNNTIDNYSTIYNIKNSKSIFFNILIKNRNKISIDHLISLFKMLNSFYDKKSLYEN